MVVLASWVAAVVVDAHALSSSTVDVFPVSDEVSGGAVPPQVVPCFLVHGTALVFSALGILGGIMPQALGFCSDTVGVLGQLSFCLSRCC